MLEKQRGKNPVKLEIMLLGIIGDCEKYRKCKETKLPVVPIRIENKKPHPWENPGLS